MADNKYSGLPMSYGEFVDFVNSLAKWMQGVNEDIWYHEGKIEGLMAKDGAQETKIANLELSLSELKDIVGQLTTISPTTEDFSNVADSVVRRVRSSLTNIKKAVLEKSNDLSNDNSELKTNLTSLLSYVEKHETEFSDIQASIADLKGDVGRVEEKQDESIQLATDTLGLVRGLSDQHTEVTSMLQQVLEILQKSSQNLNNGLTGENNNSNTVTINNYTGAQEVRDTLPGGGDSSRPMPSVVYREGDMSAILNFVMQYGGAQLRGEVETLRNRIQTLETTYNLNIGQIIEQHINDNEEVKAVKTKLDELSGSYESLRKDFDDMSSKIKALEEKYGEDIAKILERDDSQDEEIKAIKLKIEEFGVGIGEIKKTLEEHAQDIANGKKTDEDQNKEIEDLKKRVEELEKDKKTPTPTPIPPVPAPVPEPEEPEKWKKGKFLSRAVKQSTILAEPKRPWYKRLATFAIKHPVLTTLLGAGLGLGVVGAVCGVTAAAGLAAMANTMNFFLPSLAIGTGVGAVAGGTLSGVSHLFPAGRRERLYNKFAKQYQKAMKIERTADIYAALEQKHKEQRQVAREKNKQKGILKSLGVYKAAKAYHKMMGKASRKMKRYYAKKFAPKVEKALTTKAALNIKETQKGKTKAIAGYLQKKRKLEQKFADGKIDEEEFEEDLQDLDDDVADLTGGESGLSDVTNQMTYDKEAVTLIEKVKAKQRTKGMDMMLKDIKKRNTKEEPVVVERVFRDPAQVRKEIAKFEAEGRLAEAEDLKIQLAQLEKERKDYEDWARANGEEIEDPIDLNTDDKKEDKKKEAKTAEPIEPTL